MRVLKKRNIALVLAVLMLLVGGLGVAADGRSQRAATFDADGQHGRQLWLGG
jgi:hypothetical protein